MVRPLLRLRAFCETPPADTRRAIQSRILRFFDQITLSACTLYLVFKELEAQPDPTASLHRSAAVSASPRFPRFQPRRVVFGGTFQYYRPNQPLSSLNFTRKLANPDGAAASGGCAPQLWGPLGPARCV